MGAAVHIKGDRLIVTPRGLDKLWSLRRQIDVPLEHVKAATADPLIARGPLRGVRWPGTYVPGLITAGTFYYEGERAFWLVHNPNKVVVIDLDYEYFARLILEVDNPRDVVQMIHHAAR